MRTTTGILLLAFLSCFQGLAQPDSYTDSLKRLLREQTDDSVKGALLIDLAEALPDEREWLPYNRQALAIAEHGIKTTTGARRNYFYLIKGHAYGNLGYYYDYHGQREKSIDYYFKALFLYDKAGSKEDKASVYSNLGVLYTNQGDFKEAEDLLIKALNLKKKYDPFSVSTNYNNLGVLYEKKQDFRKALFYYKKALMAARKQQDHADISVALSNLGTYYYNRNDYRTAIPLFSEAIRECEIINDQPGVAWALANQGNCYMGKGAIDSAEYLILRAQHISRRFSYPELQLSIAEKLHDLYLRKKDYQRALHYYKEVDGINEKINGLTAQKQAIRQKLKYDHRMEKARISMQAKEEERRLNQQILFIFVILLISVLLGSLAYRRFRVSQKQKRIIELQKRVVEHKNKEITDSINYAKYLQQSMLPQESVLFAGVGNGFLFYQPKDIVSGDFYWRYDTVSYTYIAVADCTGHGVPGAMVSVVCYNALNKVMETSSEPEPGELLDHVRELIVKQFVSSVRTINDGMDISLLRLEKNGREVRFAGANHVCLAVTPNECLELKGNRQPIGKTENPQPYTTQTINLATNTWLYLFSDGVVDQFGGKKGKKLKLAALRTFLQSVAGESAADQHRKLSAFFTAYKGDLEQTDDVCLLGFTRS